MSTTETRISKNDDVPSRKVAVVPEGNWTHYAGDMASTNKDHPMIKAAFEKYKSKWASQDLGWALRTQMLARDDLLFAGQLGTAVEQFDGKNISTSYEIRIPKQEDGGFSALAVLPPKFREPIIDFIKGITKELNQKFASTEGKIQFEFGIIRDFSKTDLVGDFHTHQNGHFSATIALYGPGTVVAVDPKNPSLQNTITAKVNQLALITDGQRARKYGISSTDHGSPQLRSGEQRLVLLLHFGVVFPN